MSNEKARKPERAATLGPSLAMLVLIICYLAYFIIGGGLDAHVPLTFAVGTLLAYGAFYLHIPFKDMLDAMVNSISTALEAMMIILLIGCTVGTWISSGTIAVAIYYGMMIFTPKFFLLCILIICAIMSMLTGSSWTTMGTVGVAFMGIGQGMGVDPAITAGCIVCGAYFGDKQSPMSDTTNYAAAICNTGLYDHVKSMIYTTGPAYLVCMIIFTVMGLSFGDGADLSVIKTFQDGLSGALNLNPILLLPLILMIVLIALKVPAIPTILLCAILGMIFGCIFQGYSFLETAKFFMSGYTSTTGVADIDKLLTRGGMSSMFFNIALMIWSLAMAGLMQRCGIISSIMVKLSKLTQKRAGLIITHLVAEYILSYIASDPYLTMVIPAQAFADDYDRLGLDRSVMSRTCEDGGTIVCPAVPWGGNGVYTTGMLGVSTMAYLPWYMMFYINPIFVVICAITGWGCKKAAKPVEK